MPSHLIKNLLKPFALLSLKGASLTLFLASSSCNLPDTPLWDERNDFREGGMPAEVTTKAVVWGSAVSLINNPVSGTRKGLNMWTQRASLLATPLLPPGNIVEEGTSGSISQALTEIGLPEPSEGTVDYLIGGKPFFDALDTSVQNAQHRIDTRLFIYDNDDVATRYSDMLRKKSITKDKHGKTPKVRVLMDQLGSVTSWWTPPETDLPKNFEPPASMDHYLKKDSKVRVRFSRTPWLVTDHSKLFLFDAKTAYIGGMNIGREYRYEWHDMMLRLEGPIVAQLQDDFNRAWRLQGFMGDLRSLFKPSPAKPQSDGLSPKSIPIRLLKTSYKKQEIERAMISAVRMARKRIYLQNSYITSELLTAELVKAKKRGVEVVLIIPSKNDSKLLHAANSIPARALIKAGAKVYSHPQFSHIKAFVADDWSCLGSANFDGLSMRINEEINISFEDKNKTQELMKKLFFKDVSVSKRLRLKDLKKPSSLVKSVAGQL